MAQTIAYGRLVTTATTAKQTILTNTPANNLKLKTIVIAGYPTTWSATEANLGTVYLTVGGVDKMEFRLQNTDNDTLAGIVVIPLGNGLIFSGSEAVVACVTPAATTSFTWTCTYFFDTV
jgi:hypothetical protein